MNLIDLERRLARIEAGRIATPPTRVLTDAAIGDAAGDMRAADALANWRAWIATGRATVSDGVLYLVGPEMTEAEWTAAHVTAH